MVRHDRDALELEDLTRLNLNGSKGYSICKTCYADGKKVVTFGKIVQTGKRSAKRRGAKRRKAAVAESDEGLDRGGPLSSRKDLLARTSQEDSQEIFLFCLFFASFCRFLPLFAAQGPRRATDS